ncbi:hypothetical protein [Planctomyces sp. SH-PL14]|uniref:hypothetical protein n=1 Tax=Planctomyces sp. SH-PL14 TaxID=1632864 RepID=UPI00078D14C5|nr:hypothetical protein [Planctomyces sp. SH-PL14]AMV18277.1 hypothetical protein VT03_10335 [Planctomyces sp. SH-PL14]
MYLKSLSPEQTSELVTFFAGTFRGQLPFDELVLHPGTAARFVQDYVGHARIWGTPEWVILRALRDALKNGAR